MVLVSDPALVLPTCGVYHVLLCMFSSVPRSLAVTLCLHVLSCSLVPQFPVVSQSESQCVFLTLPVLF